MRQVTSNVQEPFYFRIEIDFACIWISASGGGVIVWNDAMNAMVAERRWFW